MRTRLVSGDRMVRWLVRRRGNQRGMALFLAICLLLLLSVVGATVLDLATRSSRWMGRLEQQTQADIFSDRTVAFAQQVVETLDPDSFERFLGAKEYSWPLNIPAIPGEPNDMQATGVITYVGLTQIPLGPDLRLSSILGSSGGGWIAEAYQVSAQTTTPRPNLMRVNIDTVIACRPMPAAGSASGDSTITDSDLARLAQAATPAAPAAP